MRLDPLRFGIEIQNALDRRLANRIQSMVDVSGSVIGTVRTLDDYEVLEVRVEDEGEVRSLALVLRQPGEAGIRIGFRWPDILAPDVAEYVEGAKSTVEAAELFVTLFLTNLEEQLAEENFGLAERLSLTRINWI